METLRRIERHLARLEGWFIVALLSVMVLLTSVQVLLRNLHIHGHFRYANLLLGQIDWADPLVRLLVLWVTFLGASLLTTENRHIKIDFLSGVLPSGWLPFREVILCTAAALVCGFMFGGSLEYVKVEYHAGTALFLGIPSWVTQLILPVGFLLMFLRFLFRAAGELAAFTRSRTR
ncbi:MAG: TRAP transporter small permease subunit [Desulfobacterales bacterium]|nr:TRAP transporter small permease subunit [Desulfobacterales bacterium]